MSIMRAKQDECYICRKYGVLEKHHVWHGTANRKLAEQDGLYVWLCRDCHRNLHDKGEHDLELMQIGQLYWQMVYKMPKEDFIKRYGKSVI